jgi:two-component system, LuxR family, response regulator FixJ
MNKDGWVFIIDDEEAVRDSIGMLLDTVDLKHREFADAASFLAAWQPDWKGCLVLDIRMPGMSGLELQEKLVAMRSNLPIIFITGHGDIPMAVEAMRRGAIDFIRKPFRDQELLDRINQAMSMEAAHRQRAEFLARARTLFAELTPREAEVFHRVTAGQANKVIAIDLGISERTVEIHRSQVMHKTHSRSLADLVRLKLALEDEAGA